MSQFYSRRSAALSQTKCTDVFQATCPNCGAAKLYSSHNPRVSTLALGVEVKVCCDVLYPHFGTGVLRGLCSSQLLHQHGAQVLEGGEEKNTKNQAACSLLVKAKKSQFCRLGVAKRQLSGGTFLFLFWGVKASFSRAGLQKWLFLNVTCNKATFWPISFLELCCNEVIMRNSGHDFLVNIYEFTF